MIIYTQRQISVGRVLATLVMHVQMANCRIFNALALPVKRANWWKNIRHISPACKVAKVLESLDTLAMHIEMAKC